MKYFVLMLYFLTSFMGIIHGQNLLTTLSGQKIVVTHDGNWYYDSTYVQQNQYFKNQYSSSIVDLNNEQKSYLLSILINAEIKEVNFAIRAHQLDKSISVMESIYYTAKKSKDKENTSLLKKEIDQHKKSLSRLLHYYKDASENLDLIFSLPKYSLQDKKEYILQLSEVYGVNLPDSLFADDAYGDINADHDARVTDVLIPLDTLGRFSDALLNEHVDSIDIMINDAYTDVDEALIVRDSESKTILKNPTVSPKLKHTNELIKSNAEESIHEINDPFDRVFTRPRCTFQQISKNKRTRFSATYPEFICGHVPPMAKNYFKDSNLLEIHSVIIENNKKTYLQLIITIMNRDAAKNYGIITKNALIKFIGVNGRPLNLFTDRTANTSIEAETGQIVYKVQKELSKEHIKFLSNNPLDSLGIMWSSGFEIYFVYNVDVIMNQLYCIKNKK